MKKLIEAYDPQVQRILEMLPGTIAWLMILFPLWGAFFIPRVVAYFTAGFVVYWFYRSFQAAFLGIKGYVKIRQSEKTNWQRQYKKDKKDNSLLWEDIKHLIIIPNYNESVEKLSTSLRSIANQKHIKKDQLFVVLAMEERAEGAHERADQLVKKFKSNLLSPTAIHSLESKSIIPFATSIISLFGFPTIMSSLPLTSSSSLAKAPLPICILPSSR